MGKKKTLSDHAGTLADTLAPHVENVRDQAGSRLADARDKAGPAIADAIAKAGPLLEEARHKAVPVLVDARDKAVPVLVDARDKATPVLVMAKDKAAPYLADARDKAAPVLSQARDTASPVLDKASPVLSDVRDRFTAEVLPVVTAAIAALDDATEDARAEAAKRTKALATALRGEVAPPPKEKHTFRNLLVALGLGGAAFAAVKRFTGGKQESDWKSSYTPPPATTPSPTGAPVTDVGAHRADMPTDLAASDPGEAVADATEVPHDATTPDNPVTEIDVDPPERA
jgi:hypothetical protein